jgi:hypothetical protein
LSTEKSSGGLTAAIAEDLLTEAAEPAAARYGEDGIDRPPPPPPPPPPSLASVGTGLADAVLTGGLDRDLSVGSEVS